MTATIRFYICAAAILVFLASAVHIEDLQKHLDLGSRSGLTTVLNAAERVAGGGK